MDGTTYGPIAAGVRSITLMPKDCSFSLCTRCDLAEVASKTILMSWKWGNASSPSIPSAETGTPSRAARAKPSEAGSIPIIAPILRYWLFFIILNIKSVPIFPEPIMAAWIFSLPMVYSFSSRNGRRSFNSAICSGESVFVLLVLPSGVYTPVIANKCLSKSGKGALMETNCASRDNSRRC